MKLDEDLRRAFARQPAPPDFADGVLARIARGDGHKGEPGRGKEQGGRGKGNLVGSRALPWFAAAAALTLTAGSAARYYAYQQTVADAERVKADIQLALQITLEKIALVQVRLMPDTTYERSERNP